MTSLKIVSALGETNQEQIVSGPEPPKIHFKNFSMVLHALILDCQLESLAKLPMIHYDLSSQ